MPDEEDVNLGWRVWPFMLLYQFKDWLLIQLLTLWCIRHGARVLTEVLHASPAHVC